MESTSINELNAFLKGEYMAIDSYETFIQKTTCPEVKSELQRIQQEHKVHATKISERIQNLGGRPALGADIKGKIAETISNIKHTGLKSDTDILVEAYKGEDMGIKTAAEIVKGDLDTESMTMISGIIKQDQSHLQTLKDLTNK